MVSTKSNKVNKRTAGFTLIEVLVALAIIVIAMAAALDTSGSQASSAAYLREKTIADWVALNEMTQFQLAESVAETGTTHGKTKMAGIRWYWTRIITPLADFKSVFEIKYKVYLDEKRKNSLITLVSYSSNQTTTGTTNNTGNNPSQNNNNAGSSSNKNNGSTQ